MSVMFPLVVPLAWEINATLAQADREFAVVQSVSSILAGSVFGDHVSPISDTTVLSALACRCPLTDHVKTQMPYALVCAMIATLLGSFVNGYDLLPTWAALGLVVATAVLSVRLLGKPVPIVYADGGRDDNPMVAPSIDD